MDPDGIWPDLHSLVMIEARRRQGSQVTAETRYWISSLDKGIPHNSAVK